MEKKSRINKTIKGLLAIARNPWLLNLVLSDDSVWAEYIQKKYALSGGLKTVDITTLFPGFRESIDTFAFLDGGSSVLDLCLLRALCKTFPNCSYFEIGTCRGESVANVADVCGKCYTLDLKPDQFSDKAEGSLVGFFSRNLKNVIQLYGDSGTFDYAGLAQKFDVVFIDGDHHYEFVKSDTAHVFKHLVHENSIVVWHDYTTDVIYPRNEVYAGILDGVPPALHKHLYKVSNSLCAIYIPKDLPAIEVSNVRIPDKKFKVALEVES